MKNKRFSIMVFPHDGERSKTFSFSNKKFKYLCGLGLLVFLMLSLFLVDYFLMRGTRSKYKVLVQENIVQKKNLADLKTRYSRLSSDLSEINVYVKKLNLMAGLTSSEPLKEVGGLGSGPGNSQIVTPVSPPQNMTQTKVNQLENLSSDVGQNLSSLLDHYEEQEILLASTPSIWPSRGYQSSAFGFRNDPMTGKRTMHNGIDIVTPVGNPIWATADGRVGSVKFDKSGGKMIKISHMGGVTTVYCHLSEYCVKEGQNVKRGDIIGKVGRTGKTTGPHLHYEVHVNKKKVNPFNYILED